MIRLIRLKIIGASKMFRETGKAAWSACLPASCQSVTDMIRNVSICWDFRFWWENVGSCWFCIVFQWNCNVQLRWSDSPAVTLQDYLIDEENYMIAVILMHLDKKLSGGRDLGCVAKQSRLWSRDQIYLTTWWIILSSQFELEGWPSKTMSYKNEGVKAKELCKMGYVH